MQCKTIGVEISGTSQIVGKDSNLHIAELSWPAGKLALKYVDSEVPQNCNTQELREIFPTCTDYPHLFLQVQDKVRKKVRKISGNQL